MGLPKDFHKLDLYGILGVADDADEKQISKSYRKKALKCHPDKNPDNPKAAEEFHKLSLALEILTDVTARAAYDKVLRSKQAANRRHRELDSKRKKFKEDLEAREKLVNEGRAADVDAETRLQREIERLRREGSRLLEQQQKLVEEDVKREAQMRKSASDSHATKATPKIKVTWNGKIGTNGGYDEDILTDIFSSYGDIANVLMSSKKGRALVEFNTLHSMGVTGECGNSDNQLKVKWLEGESTDQSTCESKTKNDESTPNIEQTQSTDTNTDEEGTNNFGTDVRDSRDYETIVMRKLRQAEERRKLIEEMTKDDS